LQPKEETQETLRLTAGPAPVIAIDSWEYVFSPAVTNRLNRMMPAFLRARRWYRGMNRTIRVTEVFDIIRLPKCGGYLVLIRVEYSDGEPELYTLPLALAKGEGAASLERVLARLEGPDGETGALHFGLEDRA